MGLKGKYTFKGIELDEAYVKVKDFNCSSNIKISVVEKTAAEFDDDGNMTKDATHENVETKSVVGSFLILIYKDKAARDANHQLYVSQELHNIEVVTAEDGKNPIIQAYESLKAMDAFKDYTDQ